MRSPSVLVTRPLPDAVEAWLGERYDCTFHRDAEKMSGSALHGALREYDVVCPSPRDTIDAAVFGDGLRRTKLIANFGAGVDHIDLAMAAASGIIVTNTPDAVTDPTADLAMTLILMATRRAGEGERQVRAGAWSGWAPMHMLGQGIAGKTLGLVGFGRIAQATARRARAFGMEISYTSRNRVAPALEREIGARYIARLEDLTRDADIVSLHCPGGEATRHLIDAAVLAGMKSTALLVNTARGSVVDEEALAAALSAGTIAGAALDVYEREPSVTASLLGMENVVLLPHLGTATCEARIAMGMQMGTNIETFLAGGRPPNLVVG